MLDTCASVASSLDVVKAEGALEPTSFAEASEIAVKFHTRCFDQRILRDVENTTCFSNLKWFSGDLEQAPNVTKVSGAARAHANLKAATMAALLNEAMLSVSTLSSEFEPTFHCIVTYLCVVHMQKRLESRTQGRSSMKAEARLGF